VYNSLTCLHAGRLACQKKRARRLANWQARQLAPTLKPPHTYLPFSCVQFCCGSWCAFWLLISLSVVPWLFCIGDVLILIRVRMKMVRILDIQFYLLLHRGEMVSGTLSFITCIWPLPNTSKERSFRSPYISASCALVQRYKTHDLVCKRSRTRFISGISVSI
jgi:hypothetical protein